MKESLADSITEFAKHKPMKILLAGGTGFLGRHLTQHLRGAGHDVLRLTRRSSNSDSDRQWNGDVVDANGFDAVINLAGHPIGKKHLTQSERKAILSSRVQTTRSLVASITNATSQPAVFINASAIGYYGPSGETHLTETSPPGTTYLSGVVRAWEASAMRDPLPNVRRVLLRTGIVLGRDGGIVKRLYPFFKLGLGGRLASGQQWMSWISITDYARAITHLLASESVSGPVNLVAPTPVRNREFTKAFASALHRPAVFPVPKFALNIVLGTDIADDFASSEYVVPTVLLNDGFNFEHESIDAAFQNELEK